MEEDRKDCGLTTVLGESAKIVASLNKKRTKENSNQINRPKKVREKSFKNVSKCPASLYPCIPVSLDP